MARILVYLETRDGEIREAALEALGEARRQGEEVAALLVGKGVKSLAETAAHYGADEVWVAEDERLTHYLTEPFARAVVAAAQDFQPDALFFPATPQGKDLAPRVALRLDAPLMTDITGLEFSGDTLVVTKPIYAGKIIGTYELIKKPFLVSLRPKNFEKAEPDPSRTAQVRELQVPFEETDFRVEYGGLEAKESGEISVTEADIVVSGGRGIKGPENWPLLRELIQAIAEVTGAKVALGASRAAVDAGWIDHSHQVGQTGKVVSPKLYIAVGISGAIQHLAGMRTSKVIVAVNKDPEAPIFKVADYGIVGDLFQVVPELTKEIRKLKE